MPLSPMVASVVCVAAALAMGLSARGRATRAAHAVMLLAMVALSVQMGHVAVGVVCAAVLVATAGVLVRRTTDPESRRCALDLACCAALVALMVVAAAWQPMTMPATSPAADPARLLVLGAAAVLTTVGWAAVGSTLRREPVVRSRGRVATVAPWLMVLGMGVMVVA